MTLPASSPQDVVAVCPLEALRDEGARWCQDGVALVRAGGRVHAFEDRCPHAGASLAEADVRHGTVSCSRHEARFRLADGKALSGPAKRALRCYDVEQVGDTLLVRRRMSSPAPAGTVRRLLVRLGLRHESSR